MSDYTRAGSGGATHFTDKDSKTTGDADKVIVGSQFDAEFEALVTAVNSKHDSSDFATQAEAEAESSNVKIITPLRLANWADENGGLVGEIQELADPNADAFLMWDDSAAANANIKLATAGTALAFSGTTIEISHLGFEDLADPNADRIAFWDDTAAKFDWLIPGTALTITNQTIDLDHLGFEDLVDPNADRIAFWDDSAGKFDWLVPGNGININALNLSLTASAATTTNPCEFISGKPEIDLTALTNILGSGLGSTDTFLVDDGGVPKGIHVQDMGCRVQSAQSADDFVLADANTIMEFNGTVAMEIDTNANVAMAIGSAIILVVDHASQLVQITAKAGVVLNSVFHPGGADNGSDKVIAGGTAVLIKTAADEWYLSGDIVDS